MSSSFDPYYKWLGIPPAEQPPNHYRLLGISLFESDPDVIEAAADQRMIHLRSFQAGQNSPLSQKLLNETAAAKICLLKPDRRAKYDALLRQRLAMQAGPPTAAPQPPPCAAPIVPLVAVAHFGQTDEATATAPSAPSAPENPWDPDPHDFSNLQASYTRTPVVTRTKSPLPLALLIAAPILGLAAVLGAIKVFNDREDAENDRSQNVASTSGAHNDNDKHPFSPTDSHPGKTIGDARPPLLVLDWPREERAGGFVILDGTAYEVSQRSGALAYELKPGEHQVSLRRRGWETINVTVPPKKDGERFAYKPRWKAAAPDGGATDVASIDHPTVTPLPENPSDKNPLEIPPPDKNPGASDKPLAPVTDVSSKPAKSDRAPVPDAAAQQKALAHVKEVLKDDFAAAKGSDGQIALARKLGNLANGTSDDETARYVMATQALEIAIRQFEPTLASQLVGGLSTHYDVDAWEMKVNTLGQLAHSPKAGDARAGLAKASLDLIDKAIADDRFEIAVELATTATFLSGQLKDVALRDVAKEASERARRVQKSAQDAKSASDTLLSQPNDPDANLTAGKFKCFLKGDWNFGLPLLAKGNDEGLKTLAQQESAVPTDSADQVKLAEAWWDLADKKAAEKSEAAKKDDWTIKPIRVRAAYWYKRGLSSLSGLALAKAQKRIDEADPAADATALGTTFLDDLPEQGVSVGYGRLGKHGETGYSPDRVKFRGAQPQHSLSLHPPSNGSSTVSYALDGKYHSFSGIAAIMDDAKQMQSKATFRVYGDGKLLWTSRPLRAAGEFQESSIRLSGVRAFKLEVECVGQNGGTHAVWVNPALTK